MFALQSQHILAGTYLQLPLWQWSPGNGHLLVVASLKVNIAKKRIAVIQTTIEMKNATLLINITPMKIM